MSYTVIVTSTRPANVQWFAEVNPSSFELYKAWVTTLSGIVSETITVPDTDTLVRTHVFESEAAYTNFLDAHSTNVEHNLRREYNLANGITFVSQVISD